MTITAEALTGLIADLRERHDVVGASVAVLDGDAVVCAAAGSANLGTGIEVTPDTRFQIGSITKVYTASLILQLVDEGRVELDDRVTHHLPGLRIGDAADLDGVTVRRLLSHTGGIDGDIFKDFGRGDDAVERFVAALDEVPLLCTPGERFSYANAGYGILGRLIEVLTGLPWTEALRTRLLEPAGLRETASLAEELILHRVAVGHLPDADGEPGVAPVWSLPPASAPSGAPTAATARDLLGFASLHLAEGVAADGRKVLSPDAARTMQEIQVVLPPQNGLADASGLGWFLADWPAASGGGSTRVLGHDGGTIGQAAFLRFVPGSNYAVALLTNGGAPGGLYSDLFSELFGDRLGITPPKPAEPETPFDPEPARHVGTYERTGLRLEVRDRDGRLEAQAVLTGPLAAVLPAMPPLELVPKGDGLFVTTFSGRRTGLVFSDYDANGHAQWVFLGGRAAPRVG